MQSMRKRSIQYHFRISILPRVVSACAEQLGAGSEGAVRTVTLPPARQSRYTTESAAKPQRTELCLVFRKVFGHVVRENGEGGPGFVEAGVGALDGEGRSRPLNFTMVSRSHRATTGAHEDQGLASTGLRRNLV